MTMLNTLFWFTGVVWWGVIALFAALAAAIVFARWCRRALLKMWRS